MKIVNVWLDYVGLCMCVCVWCVCILVFLLPRSRYRTSPACPEGCFVPLPSGNSNFQHLYWEITHIPYKSPFSAYNSMTFSIFTDMCNHHKSLEIFITSKRSHDFSMCPHLTFFFLQYWSLNSGPIPWATSPALFCFILFCFVCDGFFPDRVSWTICLG
jgi:hypothetical protein